MNSSASGEEPSIFIDRNSGGRTLREALTLAGVKFVLHDDIFPITESDHGWLRRVSELGHIVVTGDQDCMKRYRFLQELAETKTYVFILFGLNGATAEGKAQCILSALSVMRGIMDKNPPPAIWKIYPNNSPRRCPHEATLARMFKSNRRP